MAYWFGAVVRTCLMKGSSQLVVSMSRERERERERERAKAKEWRCFLPHTGRQVINTIIDITYLKSAAIVPQPIQRYDSALLNQLKAAAHVCVCV